jgi:hypothetical protein
MTSTLRSTMNSAPAARQRRRASLRQSKLELDFLFRFLGRVEVHEHVAVAVPESAQGFFCPRHDGQLRCDVLEKFPPEPSRHEAGDVEDRLQLLIGEGERGHGPRRLCQPPRSGTGLPKKLGTWNLALQDA